MRLVAGTIAAIALIGAALVSDSMDDRMQSKELMEEMRDRQALIEAHGPVRSDDEARHPAERVDTVEVRAGEDELIDTAEGYDPSGIDPVGFDPTPEDDRTAASGGAEGAAVEAVEAAEPVEAR